MENRRIYYISEFFGTFLLVFLGTGSVIISEEYNGIIQAFGIGIVFGVTVWLLVQFFGKFSDCHINPAVTIAFLWNKQIQFKQALLYVFFQLIGALCASICLHFLFEINQNLGNTLPSGSWQESFILEFFLSFALMMVILISTTQKVLLKFAPFLIGSTVFLEAWLAGPICGASMNPARSFGPAAVSENMFFLPLYILGPISGMILAVVLLNFIYKN
ncbi:aquaporin [Flavobacterium jejuense]|uniref:Aquaporin n=1 Tax=Flavobacterium jejuense TaxID=1544455 RepID=A0ABX0IVR1_9FLAO|nr:aquaporin [Flavobacterium jejuense]NHN27902.1 aquaporin [Flavobacterium jejuense]